LQKLREDTAERRELLIEFEELKKDKLSLMKELERYRDSDPDVIAAEKNEIEVSIHYIIYPIPSASITSLATSLN